MPGTGHGSTPRRAASLRALAGAVFALWCLLLAGGDATRALCLDLGGHCSSPAADAQGPCHDRDAGGGPQPCGACVEVPIPDDASAAGRAGAGAGPLVVTASFRQPAAPAAAPAGAAVSTAFAGRPPRDFWSRGAALRI